MLSVFEMILNADDHGGIDHDHENDHGVEDGDVVVDKSFEGGEDDMESGSDSSFLLGKILAGLFVLSSVLC
jgi:hypothetical protein